MTVKKSKTTDLEEIIPAEGALVIDGIPAVVKRLKSREFLSLIRVLTIGLGPGIADLDLSGTEDEVKQKMGGLFIVAIPHAIEEFGEFLFSVVDAKSGADRGALRKAMENPDIEVMLDVIATVILQEQEDFAALVGKAKAAMTRIQSLYQPQRRSTGS